MEKLVIDPSFWKGRNIFLTGHTGFKGSWLSLCLKRLGANVTGYALEAPTDPSIFEIARVEETMRLSVHGDVRDAAALNQAMRESKPEIVIHMAAQSLVRDSYSDPVATYSTNVMGTVNVLEAARSTSSVKAILNITTDKCYENNEWVWGYRENDPMGGHDPYSNSKACAELISASYRKSFLQASGLALATARAGNVIGGGDWAKDRIVPDAIRAFTQNKPLVIRNPLSTRPWQHVLEPLSGYLILCQQLIEKPLEFDQGWNFGPNDDDVQPVSSVANIMTRAWGEESEWTLDTGVHQHEARSLKLDCSKAKALLKWSPIWDLEKALTETVQWYKAWDNKQNMNEFTLKQIDGYLQYKQLQ
ncbi:MAG: CDP-glucose 4,6-dehydratase [Granulosicoccus sp.]|jgi:CDP-glucose 4,6-dehydratase